MKKMKKILAMVMTVIMAMGMLAGCGNSKAATEGTTGAAVVDSSKPLAGKKLKVMCSAFKPWRYADTTGKYIGIDFQIIDELAKRLGFTYEFEEIEFAGTVTAISTGQGDMACTMSYTEERAKSLDFSEPYYYAVTGILTMDSSIKSWSDLKGKKVGVAQGTTFETVIKKADGVNVTSLDRITTAVEELRSGRVDAVYCDAAQANAYAKDMAAMGAKSIVVTENEIGKTASDYRWSFTKGSEYVKYINEALEEMKKDGTLNKIIADNLGAEYCPDWSKK